MAGITLAQAEAKLAEYLSAESKILLGQKVAIDGQELTRAHLEFVQQGIATWNERARNLSATASGRGRMRTVAVTG